ncbi:type IV pilus biosynthesis protein PilQ [Candidatus Glomeribacter gigasporarum BEG34]|uniref:Type IV pilus biosynthesis protein PilQ n=1 Tax=Candidatus Glomeribacter gigasporarum BEG34 TaxID=1070319 RepID=G2J979_9BURK|nr:ATPase, T2SS/T4P/T4SS family [Candidatus Glomeribacter gigasporarum]CCD29326.1 type IV pilus biosynthesis protein PilQ [Candidatus Glomeribacter gigasporarum BEG34]
MNAVQILTAPGGPYALSAPLQDMICLTGDGTLYVSASHEKDHHVLSFIERLTRHAHPFRVEKVSLTQIKQLYDTAQTGAAPMLRTASSEGSTHRQTEVVRLIREAVEKGASDVHFIVDPRICAVRFRIHGELITAHELTAQHGNDLCTTIYQSMCDVADSIYNPGKSRDARLKRSFIQQCGLFGARVGTRPLDTGVLMVLRLLYDRRGAKPTLDALGYLPEQIALIRRMSQQTTGINIFSGPTGSGKSTTLECVLTDLMRRFDERIHLLTIEDPPEYAIPGANQTPILCDKDDDEALSHEWARAISNAMRLDPDVMMIGEIRDLSSAVAAFRAAMTGHGVWTTLHTNDAVSILERLRDLGVEEGLLTDPALMTGLVNQSLVRKLCLQCRRPYLGYGYPLADGLAPRIEDLCEPERVWLKGEGCVQCNGTGISGRMVIAEVIAPNKAFMRIFKTQGKSEAVEYWMRHLHGITKNQHLIRCINEGLVDPLHGERDVGLLDADQTIFER